jgi:hypothetical protein
MFRQTQVERQLWIIADASVAWSANSQTVRFIDDAAALRASHYFVYILRFALHEGDFAVVLCENGARLTVRVLRQQSRHELSSCFVQLLAFL